MNIYMITRREPCGHYDIYDGAVVYAESAAAARNTHPKDGRPLDCPKRSRHMRDTWVTDPKDVCAKLVGTAPDRKRPGVIMVDFNAG